MNYDLHLNYKRPLFEFVWKTQFQGFFPGLLILLYYYKRAWNMFLNVKALYNEERISSWTDANLGNIFWSSWDVRGCISFAVELRFSSWQTALWTAFHGTEDKLTDCG